MNTKTQRLVGLSILAALVIVVQTFAAGVKIGPFSPPLALIPIIVGAVLFGKIGGLILGLVFGIVVSIAVIAGAEPFSTLMFNFNPVVTIFVCLFKGSMAGFISGLVHELLCKKNAVIATVISSFVTPFVNTGIFSIFMLTVFKSLVDDAAAGAGSNSPVFFFFTVFIGFGFIFDLVFVSVVVPAIVRIIKIVGKK